MIQKNLLKILFVEDVPSDVDLAVLELRKEKIKFEYTTVCSRIDLIKALKEFNPDLIISDYMMPAFNGLQALKESKAFNPGIPFILYTGSVNEETAVECIKAGAQDYVIKEHSTRLPFAVKDALEQVRIYREKRASELLLKENEEKLQSIFSAAPVGIGLVVDRILIEMNDTLCKMTGYSRRELVGKSAEILYSTHEEYIDAGIDKYQQISERGTGTVESRFKCKDGTNLNVIISSTPLDIDDHSKGVTFTILDITDRKHAEEAIAESEAKYRNLVTQSPDGIFIIDFSGQFISVNKAICDNLHYTEEELLAAKLWDIVPDQYHGLHKQRLLSIINGESTSSNAEYEVKGKDGRLHSIEVMSSPYYKGKEIIGFQGIARDITERKRAELALRASEEKYRVIFENVQDVYYETSVEGIILEVSPSIGILSNGQYNMEDLIGKSMFNFYTNAEKREQILSELRENGAVTDFEISLRNGDGSDTPCSVSAKLVFDAEGQAIKIIGSMHDITELKNASNVLRLAKEKAEASDRLKTEFLNNISHEVRTPLNGILGFAEIISMQDLSEEEKKDSLAMLFESSNRLLNTITNYMDISLITSGSLSVNKKNFIPSTILQKIFNNFEPACLSKKLNLFLEIPEQSENHHINSDPEICLKIISHFLDNAVKFTESGDIHFGYNLEDEQLVFFVRDTGIGINLISFNSIFERFVKEGQGSYKVTEGSGLGLSIARGMSEAIGGKITLESKPGAGSCFFLTIPVYKVSKAVPPSGSGIDRRIRVDGSTILVAEDDDTNFYYLNALITRETDAKVLHASNGREAIELFRTHPDIKLILMDMKMPEIDGFEATRQIKMINRDVNIIAITAYAMSGDEERIIAAGCDGYLSKPINRKSLMEKIAVFIKI
jgi:PAS domain S-box-containing protein